MAKRTKIRDAATASEFREAVVERWRSIWQKRSPKPPETPREVAPRRRPSDGDRFEGRLGSRRLFDVDGDNEEDDDADDV